MPFRTINGYAGGAEAWISLAITVIFAVLATGFIGRMYDQPSPFKRMI